MDRIHNDIIDDDVVSIILQDCDFPGTVQIYLRGGDVSPEPIALEADLR
jgi:hypothetical protein